MNGQQHANRWDVMSMREYTTGSGEQKTQWTKIGVAFTNKNGSINVQLDAFPLDGKLQLQVPLTREEREAMFANKQQGLRGGGQQRQGNDGGGFAQRNGGGGQQQRFGQRGRSQPQRGGFTPTQSYEPDPEEGEQGWEVNGVWITNPSKLPQDHPDHIPF